MLIKRKTDEGFINPAWERFNRLMGVLTLFLLIGGLITVLFLLAAASSPF